MAKRDSKTDEQTGQPRKSRPRALLVAHIREQIAAGTYATRGKLEIVAERLRGVL